jgi:hypothetical protein
MFKSGINKLHCDAFPNGIPDDILMGKIDHIDVYDGDNGIQFEPFEENEYGEEYVVPDEEIKENSKCKWGTVDESFRCGLEGDKANSKTSASKGFNWTERTSNKVINNPFVEGIPSMEKVKEIKAVIDANKDKYNPVYMKFYHGTSPTLDIEGEGLLPTSKNRRRSYQSTSGYVYLANTPERAKSFGDLGNGGKSTVYEVLVPVSKMLADKDQLANQRGTGVKVGDTVAESIVYGGGVRVKGKIDPWQIKKYEMILNAESNIIKENSKCKWGTVDESFKCTPEDEVREKGIEKVIEKADTKRISDDERPAIYAGDIEGMADGIDAYKKDGNNTFHDTGDGIIVKVGGKEAGYISMLGDDETDLSVAKEFQGKGLGKKLALEFFKKYPDMLYKTGGFTEAGKATFKAALRELQKDKKEEKPKQFDEKDLSKKIKLNNDLYTIFNDEARTGPLDGGCYAMAKAIQNTIGGDLYTVQNYSGIGQHVVVKVGKNFWDGNGKSSERKLLKEWGTTEGVKGPSLRPFREDDVPDSPRTESLINKVTDHLQGKPRVDSETITETTWHNDWNNRLIAAQDMRDELKSNGLRLKISESDGAVVLYHGTSNRSAESIMRGKTLNEGSYFSHTKGNFGSYGEGASNYAKLRGEKDSSGGKVMEFKVDARDVSFSSGTGEIYAEGKLIQDPYDYVWKDPKRVVQQKQNSYEVKENRQGKCKWGTVDESFKCGDEETESELFKSKITIDDFYDAIDKADSYSSSGKYLSDEQMNLDTIASLLFDEEHPEEGQKILEKASNDYSKINSMMKEKGASFDESDAKYRLLSNRKLFTNESVFPFPVYVSANKDDKMTVGLMLSEDGKFEMFEGNEEASEETQDLVNDLMGIGEKMVKVWASHTPDVIDRIKNGDIPEGIFVSPSKEHAEGYWGKDRDLVSFKIPLNRLSQHSEVDWKVRPKKPAMKQNEEYVKPDEVKLNYRCAEGTVESGRFLCGTSSNDLPNEEVEEIIKLMADKSKSMLTIPSTSKMGENSKYLKALDNDILIKAKYNSSMRKFRQKDNEYKKKIDDLYTKYGASDDDPDSVLNVISRDDFTEEHDKIVAERKKVFERFEKEREYYKLKINESYQNLVKTYADEHRYRTSNAPDGIYDAVATTYGNIKTDSTRYVFDTVSIVKDKRSNMDIDELFFKISCMPTNIASAVTRVEVLEYANPDDAFWSEKTGHEFKSAGCAGGGKVSLFEQGNIIDKEVLTHEAAHNLDFELGSIGDEKLGQDPNKFYKFSEKKKSNDPENPTWFDAMKEDVKLPHKYENGMYVSAYAEMSSHIQFKSDDPNRRETGLIEDFAESIKEYLNNNESFRLLYPNRSKVLDKYVLNNIKNRDDELKQRARNVLRGGIQ